MRRYQKIINNQSAARQKN